MSKLIHVRAGNQLSVEPGQLQARCSFLSMKVPWFLRLLGGNSDLKIILDLGGMELLSLPSGDRLWVFTDHLLLLHGLG